MSGYQFGEGNGRQQEGKNMLEEGYKLGIRIEKIGHGVQFGIGATWFLERALVIDFLNLQIHIGIIYDLDK